jgi:AcrR family transcriptional regulator
MISMAVNRIHSTASAQRRQKQIEDCLYENLLHTPWQSISVADICRQVGISRKAYYNYYKDKEACFCAYIDRLIRDALLVTSQNIPDSDTPLEAAVMLLDYWKSKKPFFDILIKNGLTYFLIAQTSHYVLTEDRTVMDRLSTEEIPSDADILTCYSAIQIMLILQWHSRGFDTPTVDMAKKFLRLMHEPLVKVVQE